jgi:hypothetical protein
VAPDTTLPLGSVTVPLRDVEEIWARSKPVHVRESRRSAHVLRSFIGTSRVDLSYSVFPAEAPPGGA